MHTQKLDTRSTKERTYAFSLEIRRAREVLAVEPVLPSDLVDLRSEALWIGAARRGQPELTPESGVRGPFPALGGGVEGSCAALVFRVGGAAAAQEITFRRECFLGVAQRATARLVAAGALRAGDEFEYRLRYVAEEPADATLSGSASPTAPVRAAAPLARSLPAFGRRALGPLLAAARAVDAEHALASDHSVVIVRSVIERARAIAARGLGQRPPIETGGILVGRRVACPNTGEAFVLVEEALEARHAVSREFSLEFSGETWQGLQGVLQRRQAAPATTGQLLIGQFHVHPFLPDGGVAPCTDCERLAVCTRSSARPSSDDRSWCKAVFHEAPWQLSLMFGLDALGRERIELYGQRGGDLGRRGYHVVESLPDVSSEPAATPSTPEA